MPSKVWSRVIKYQLAPFYPSIHVKL